MTNSSKATDSNPSEINPTVCILTKEPLKQYFDTTGSAESKKMEFIMDYLKRWDIPCYTISTLFGKIRNSFPHGHIDDIGFINSMILDGTTITGASSFASEEKDIIFLAGNLAIRGHKRILILVNDKAILVDSENRLKQHGDVFKTLTEQGFEEMVYKIETPNGFIGLIGYIDPIYYKEKLPK